MSRRKIEVQPHTRAGKPVSGYSRQQRKRDEWWLLPEPEDPWWEEEERAPLRVKLLALVPVALVVIAVLIALAGK
jgi:hypothetical protein